MDLIKQSELPTWLAQKFGSANEMAEKLDITRQTAHNLLTGKTAPNAETCEKLDLVPVYLSEEKENRKMRTLDEFLSQRSRDQERRGLSESAARLLREQGETEWNKLKSAAKATADLVGEVDGVQMQWNDIPFDFLKLQYVAASFSRGRFASGTALGCRVVFGRIPGAMYVDDSSIAQEVWDLALSVCGGKLVWDVNGNELLGLSTEELAQQIVMRVIDYRDRYQSAYTLS